LQTTYFYCLILLGKSNGLPSEYFCPNRGSVVEKSLRKDISISVASAGVDKNVEDIKVHLKSNNTHIMCNGLGDIQPQIIDKNSDGYLLCQDDHNMFANVNYKAKKLKL
jgi:hypothetical protein